MFPKAKSSTWKRIDRDCQPSDKGRPSPALLVPGEAPVLLEESWSLVYGSCGCGVYLGVRDLADKATAPTQADTDPPYMLIDSIRHSVFCTGLKVRAVENPALPNCGAAIKDASSIPGAFCARPLFWPS